MIKQIGRFKKILFLFGTVLIVIILTIIAITLFESKIDKLTFSSMNDSEITSSFSVSNRTDQQSSSIESKSTQTAELTTKITTIEATTTKQTTTKPTTKPTTQKTTAATTKATTTVAPTEPTTTAPPKSYAGLLWYAMGDSITFKGLYADCLVRNIGFRYYYNDGIAGTKMAAMADRVTHNKLATFDLVTVFAGTNDYGESTPLGTINDGATVNTFYGHVQKVIDKIRTANANTELVFLTPIIRGQYEQQPFYPAANDAGFKLQDYVQAIKDVCSKNSVKVIDLYRTSGITLENLSIYTSDNLHPNWDGAEIIAQAIQRGLEH